MGTGTAPTAAFRSANDNVRDAAIKVINISLTAKPDEKVLLVFDRFGQDVADGFLEAALVLSQRLSAIYVPVAVQEAESKGVDWEFLETAITTSRHLITALTDGHSSTAFRVGILRAAVAHNLRCVHMPGVGEEIFLLATRDVDFREMNERARQTGDALTRALIARIHTLSKVTGERHCLTLYLEGRGAHSDGGVVQPGEIINIPTGEAYIAPLESATSGSIVINGSFPEVDLSAGREVILTFDRGRIDLSRCQFPRGGTGDHCQDLLSRAFEESPSELQVGELGIGLNEAIQEVAGRTILDEKVSGTAHIAIGSNRPFGGENDAPYHLDLVFYPEAIFLDDTALRLPWKAR